MTIQLKSYLAGFLDADGSIMIQLKRRKGSKFLFRVKTIIVFYQDTSKFEELVIIHQALKAGYIYKRNDHISEIRIEGFTQVNKLLLMLKPYVRFKKDQVNLMLSAIKILQAKRYDLKDFLRVCEIADLISQSNYSNKNRKYNKDYVSTELKNHNLIPVTTGVS